MLKFSWNKKYLYFYKNSPIFCLSITFFFVQNGAELREIHACKVWRRRACRPLAQMAGPCAVPGGSNRLRPKPYRTVPRLA